MPFPSPTGASHSRSETFLTYLDYFRSVIVSKVDGLAEDQLRRAVLPSGWTLLELVKHLTYVERRWLVWGFLGEPVAEPWGDSRDGRWYVSPQESPGALVAALLEQGEVSRAVVGAHQLSDVGRPGERWDGAEPATLERVLFHLLQEYARHAGHADASRELLDGEVGE
ncbi:MAG TPA: DinB family protein [Actinomycetales bacterium]|jgi:uncharacterized damage-inducible protein DinB